MGELVDRVEELAEFFTLQAEESDTLGLLPDQTAKALRELGVVRALQPKDLGGTQSHPREFFEAVLAIGNRAASAGWVASVVGVHSFELAQGTRELQEEIWGEDPDTWVASPYAPIGRARRSDGGWIFSGRWPFSSGTDHCSWVVLGGMLTDDDGGVRPDGLRHFIIPRSDYTVLHDSWNVMGLQGTGSKDVVIDHAFVPDHRIIDPEDLGRHHSFAYATAPHRRQGIGRLTFEIDDLDLLGRQWDAVQDREVPILSTFGKHTNDKMISFYVRSPSGFGIEYGVGGILIDDETWLPTRYDSAHYWGHRRG